MLDCKKDFPLFRDNADIVFLDNGASTQRPSFVVDGVNEYINHHYANIHRGLYEISEESEEYYHASKEKCAEVLWCKASEIIYTYNSTYGFNIIAQSLVKTWILGKGDSVLLGVWEHHSNIVPWQILAEMFGFEVKFVDIDDNHDIDRDDFAEKYDDSVKVVSFNQVSNVSGKIYDMKQVKSKLREDTFFIVDWSQGIPHFQSNMEEIWCDCYIFTGHKLMAYSGIGVIYLKQSWIRDLQPMMWWGGTVKDVTTGNCELVNNNEKFEFGTPNLIGAVSLLKAFEYMDKIGGYEKIEEHEQALIKYTLEKFAKLEDKVKLVGPTNSEERVGCFSFVVVWMENFNLVSEKFAEKNICVRCGGHCAYPLHHHIGLKWTCRMSLYIYNDFGDVDKFFEVLEEIIK